MQEWTDVASRDSAAPFLQQLMLMDPLREADSAAAAAAGGGRGVDADADADDSPSLQLAGNGGDGMFEAAVVQLVAALHGGSLAGFREAMLEGIAGLAAAAGLLRKPAGGYDSNSSDMCDDAELQASFTGMY